MFLLREVQLPSSDAMMQHKYKSGTMDKGHMPVHCIFIILVKMTQIKFLYRLFATQAFFICLKMASDETVVRSWR